MRIRAWYTYAGWCWHAVSGGHIIADGRAYNRRIDMVRVINRLCGVRVDTSSWGPTLPRSWVWTSVAWSHRRWFGESGRVEFYQGRFRRPATEG